MHFHFWYYAKLIISSFCPLFSNFYNFFLQTEVTTVICGHKELKKIIDISGQLDTVQRVICMDDWVLYDTSLANGGRSWTITSFADVEKLGRENPVDADLPLSADIAVIMYTSGSTGLPKVSRNIFLSSVDFSSLWLLSDACI